MTNRMTDNSDMPEQQPAPGSVMQDGSIYVGISSHTGRPLYAMAEDAPGLLNYEEAKQYARTATAGGHNDWRVPSETELAQLFRSKNVGKLTGTFNENAADPKSWYQATPEFHGYNDSDNEINFANGNRDYEMKVAKASLRLVRG